MLFMTKRKQNSHKLKVVINKYSIEQVHQFRYLGVTFDHKLNWNTHIDYVALKLSQCAGIIYKAKNKLPPKILTLIYNITFTWFLFS